MSSIQSSPPAEEIADGSNNANIGSVPLVASSANLNKVATTTNDPNGSAATAIVAQGTTNPPARHRPFVRRCRCTRLPSSCRLPSAAARLRLRSCRSRHPSFATPSSVKRRASVTGVSCCRRVSRVAGNRLNESTNRSDQACGIAEYPRSSDLRTLSE